MARQSFAAFIMLLMINAGTVAMTESGLSSAVGADLRTDAGESFAAAADGFDSLRLTGGLADLFGAITAGTQALAGLFQTLYAGPEMLIQLGLPGWVVAFLFAPLAALIGRDIIYFATSR